METVKKNKLLLGTAICCSLLSFGVGAKEIDMNTAQMQAMDKITGKVSVIEVPVNGSVKFGSFSIVVRACKTRPPEETPENYAFIDVVDDYNGTKPLNIFRGWQMSSTPSLNAVEHPIYDVWLLKCVDRKVDKSQLLSAEALKERDNIEKAPKVETVKVKPLPVADENAVKSINENEDSSAQDKASDVLDKRKIEELAISNPEPLIEDEVQPVAQAEDGAPQSLLNIGNFKVEKAPAEDAPVAEEAEISVVEEVVIGQENAPAPETLLPEQVAPADNVQPEN